MSIVIRKAENKDAKEIADMLLTIGEIHHNGRPDIYKDNLQKYNEKDLIEIFADQGTLVLVASNDNCKILGYAICQIKEVEDNHAFVGRKYLYIDDFCVNENCRGQHVGTKLIEKIKEEAENLNIKSIELNVWEFNSGAVRFYEKCGFKTQRREMEIIL